MVLDHSAAQSQALSRVQRVCHEDGSPLPVDWAVRWVENASSLHPACGQSPGERGVFPLLRYEMYGEGCESCFEHVHELTMRTNRFANAEHDP